MLTRELSNGHFSDDNQKQLTGTEIDVPIFEAKMTRDSRLVVSHHYFLRISTAFWIIDNSTKSTVFRILKVMYGFSTYLHYEMSLISPQVERQGVIFLFILLPHLH